jgi:periplasmic protein TonB
MMKDAVWASVILHGALFGVTAFSPQAKPYAVAQSQNSVEVAIVYEQPKQIEEKKEEEYIAAHVSTEAPPVAVEPEHKEQPAPQIPEQASASQQGAISDMIPDTTYNPAPVYPQTARRNGWEGSVTLIVKVSSAGKPEEVSVEKSSGHAILDSAAVLAVKRWRFKPAGLGGMNLSSTVRIPVRFVLKD